MITFSLADADGPASLSVDATGRVVAAHLVLDTLPADGELTLVCRSPQATWAVPAATLFVHLKIAAGVISVFRPSHVPTEAQGPFTLSTKHHCTFLGALVDPSGKAYPLQGFEAVAKNQLDGAEVRIDAHADPKSPNRFASDPIQLPRGHFDVTLHLILPSGTPLTVRLPRYLQSQELEEVLLLEIKQHTGSDEDDTASHTRSSIDFGPLGDTRAAASVMVWVRTRNAEYPITVIPAIELADPNGTTPSKPWIKVTPAKVLLSPGKTERLHLRLLVPDDVEAAIVDGPFQGLLQFTRADTGETMPVLRAQPISGVRDDEPVNQIRFDLKRPIFSFQSPHGLFGSRLRTFRDGRQVLQVRFDVGPMTRTVSLVVSHDSASARTITVRPDTSLRDPTGKQVLNARVTPGEGGELTQEVSTGTKVTWLFDAAIAPDTNQPKIVSGLDVSAPGMRPQRIDIEILVRRPLLGVTLQRGAWILAGLFAVGALWAFGRWLPARSMCAGKQFSVTPERPLPGFIRLESKEKDLHVMTEQPLAYGRSTDATLTPIQGNRRVPMSKDSLVAEPLVMERDGVRLGIMEICPEPPQLLVEVLSAPEQMAQAQVLRRRWLRRTLLASTLVLLAMTLLSPRVLPAAQWLVDCVPFF